MIDARSLVCYNGAMRGKVDQAAADGGGKGGSEPRLLRGEVLFDAPPPDLAAATIHVRVEDTSLADAESRVVAEQVLRQPPPELEAGEGIPFVLRVPEIDPRASYSVSVHVAFHDTDRIRTGDYINMESHPVLTHGYPDRVGVRVRRVGG
jgi:uncharacterized lipoprotein YbaY